jgi:uncharacterized UBP type Zn finger protein
LGEVESLSAYQKRSNYDEWGSPVLTVPIIGFKNKRNAWYLNSVMQALLRTKPFCELLSLVLDYGCET